MKKPKIKEIGHVTKESLHEIADLHYTPIVTLPVIDAVLIAAGSLEEYESTLPLTPRRDGRKLYLRAASYLNESSVAQLREEEPYFYEQLKQLSVEFEKMRKRCARSSAKVTFTEASGLLLPTNCIIGHCVPHKGKMRNDWIIAKPVMLDKFYDVAGRGGFYFIRQLEQ